jgi:SAM-dependent methyltransferase
MMMNNAKCPLCLSENLDTYLLTRDYSLTQQEFHLLHCNTCTGLYTKEAPSKEDIGPFYAFKEYISHTNDNEGFINKLYQRVRKITLAQKTNWIQSLLPGQKGTLLDIGAGVGAFAHAMQQIGWNVVGIEPDADTRKRAHDTFQISLQETNALFSFQEKSFDVITLWHVLEHVHDLDAYLQIIEKVLKDNGKLVIAVPNYTSLDAQFYKSYWAAYDVPRHLYHFSPKSMQILLERFQLEIIKHKPMWFDSFYVGLLSEKYKKSGPFGYVRAFIVGFLSNIKALTNPSLASSVIYEIKKRGS